MSEPYKVLNLVDCSDLNEVYEELSIEYGEFPISKSNSLTYFVSTMGTPIGTLEGFIILWFNQQTQTMTVVFETGDQACILAYGSQTKSYK